MASHLTTSGACRLMVSSGVTKLVTSDPELMKVKTQVLYIGEQQEYFIHIPKCGGTSVRDQLILTKHSRKLSLETIETGNHSKYDEIGKLVDLETSNFIVSVRHPVGRFLSAYNFLMDIDTRKIEQQTDLPEQEMQFYTARLEKMKSLGINGFVALLRDLNKRQEIYDIWYTGYPEPHFKWAFEPQVDWIAGIPETNIKSFKIETQEIFEYLNIAYGSSKIKQYNRSTSEENKQAIYEYFSDDFKRFGYSLTEEHNNLAALITKREENAPKWIKNSLKKVQIKKTY